MKCQFCFQSFKNRKGLHYHGREDHWDKVVQSWLKCRHCGTFFPELKSLKSHQKYKNCDSTKRKFGDKIQCQFCSMKFKGKKGLYFHARQRHKDQISDQWLKCLDCKTFFPDSQCLKLHQRSCSKEDLSKKIFQLCPFCDRKFKGSKGLYYHARQVHWDQIVQSWMKCQTCSVFFPDNKSLTFHKITCNRSSNPPYQCCLFCKSKFKGRRSRFHFSNIIIYLGEGFPGPRGQILALGARSWP
jgi:hypothetical protein